MDGTLGLDVRYIEDQAVITSVVDHLPAAVVGLQRGNIILQVNDQKVQSIAEARKSEPTPPYNDRNLESMITQDIIRTLYGIPGDTIKIEYLDSNNEIQHPSLVFKIAR